MTEPLPSWALIPLQVIGHPLFWIVLVGIGLTLVLKTRWVGSEAGWMLLFIAFILAITVRIFG